MLHQIGIGALGPVFRTYEPTRDRLVAIKVFRLDIVPEQAQLLADALTHATQASLFHPSIVEPIAAGMEGTVAYRAEEYVAAESLDVAMRHYAPAPIEKVLPFITQLAGAIDFARAAGVGHGALHPRDIFVTPDEARATGFGVVEALESAGIRAPIRRPYTAPERIAATPWSTPADVFSLGVIAFELLTGRRPAGTGAQIGQLADGPFAAPIHAVLARAMDANPENRFPTALGFASALEAARRGDAASTVVPIPVATPVHATVAVPLASAPDHADPTPGEFAVEKELDPVFSPIVHAEPTLFDDRDDDVMPVAPEPGQFADEFVEEQRAEAEGRRPLEASYETVPVAAAKEPAMFATTGITEPEAHDYADRARPSILPYAVTLLVGLLIGFGAAYFMWSGSRGAATPAGAGTAATGPATSETPGQYSEQKVTTPPPPGAAQPSPSSTPPPVPDESSAARGASTPPSRGTSTPGSRGTSTPGSPGTSSPGSRGSSTAPSRGTATPASGRVTVTSTPPRASVTVNGQWRGRTPLTLENLKFGRYVVRVVQPGYSAARDEFTLSAQQAAHQFSPRLQREGAPAAPAAPAPRPAAPAAPRGATPGAPAASPQAFSGSLYVDSRPRGATVFIDNRRVGQTPLSIPEVSIGSHVVRLEMAGKQPWSTTARVVAGETARVTGSLEDLINR